MPIIAQTCLWHCKAREAPLGRIFSRLPLEVSSGMPAHLSALFWTSTDRRTLVVDADKDQGHWAADNRAKLEQASRCLISLLAKKAAAEKSVPLNYFPSERQPSTAAKLLHELFYKEVAHQSKSSHSEQILFTVAGQPVCHPSFPLVLLSTYEKLPPALQDLQAPVVVVNEAAMNGLQGADPSLFQPLTPASFRHELLEACFLSMSSLQHLPYFYEFSSKSSSLYEVFAFPRLLCFSP